MQKTSLLQLNSTVTAALRRKDFQTVAALLGQAVQVLQNYNPNQPRDDRGRFGSGGDGGGGGGTMGIAEITAVMPSMTDDAFNKLSPERQDRVKRLVSEAIANKQDTKFAGESAKKYASAVVGYTEKGDTIKKQIPQNTVLETKDGTLFRAERVNGFQISGRTVENRNYSIDLRRDDAIIRGKAETEDFFYKGQFSF